MIKGKVISKKDESIFPSPKDWVCFLESRAATDVQIVIGAAALIATIATVGIGIPLIYFENLGIYLFLLGFIFLVMIAISAYYFFVRAKAFKIAPRREAIKARELADDIISGKITELSII